MPPRTMLTSRVLGGHSRQVIGGRSDMSAKPSPIKTITSPGSRAV